MAAREQLAKREALAKARVNDIQKHIQKHSEYRLDLENLKSLIGQTEKLCGSLGETIERLKIELGARRGSRWRTSPTCRGLRESRRPPGATSLPAARP